MFTRGSTPWMVALEGDLGQKTADQQKLLQNVQLSLVTQMNEQSKVFGDEQRKYLTSGSEGGYERVI